MLGPLNRHIGRKLVSFIVAFGLACTFLPIPASAGDEKKSCEPSIPHDLLPSEFEELREKILSSDNRSPLKLSFKPNFDLASNPFVHLLSNVRHIDHGKFVSALITLEALEIRSQKSDFCQYVFISEIASTLRYSAIKSLISKDTRNLGMWNGFGHGALRYFTINDYGTAKCIILNARVETLKQDREPTIEEYPRHCVVR